MDENKSLKEENDVLQNSIKKLSSDYNDVKRQYEEETLNTKMFSQINHN